MSSEEFLKTHRKAPVPMSLSDQVTGFQEISVVTQEISEFHCSQAIALTVHINITSLLNSLGGVGSLGMNQTLELVVWVTWLPTILVQA